MEAASPAGVEQGVGSFDAPRRGRTNMTSGSCRMQSRAASPSEEVESRARSGVAVCDPPPTAALNHPSPDAAREWVLPTLALSVAGQFQGCGGTAKGRTIGMEVKWSGGLSPSRGRRRAAGGPTRVARTTMTTPATPRVSLRYIRWKGVPQRRRKNYVVRK
jgi:hypothetical protein